MGRLLTNFGRDRRGGVAVAFALSATALLSASSAAVDLIALTTVRAKMQDVADAAALQAVREITLRNASDSDAKAGAANLVVVLGAEALPFGGTATPTITIDSRDPAQVTVSIAAKADLPIGLFANEGSIAVEAQAEETEGVAVSLLLLDPAAPQVWQVGGTSDVISVEGVAHVNSASAAALSGVGDALVDTKATLVVGPVQAANNWTPPPTFNAAPLPDPWAKKVTWPDPSSCDHIDKQVKNSTAALSPGVYCGGLSLRTHATANLAPGVYILKDGDLDVDSGSTLMAPQGVTIVLVGDTSSIEIQSGAEVTLVAPTTGPWANLAIAIEPQPTVQTSTLIGGGELNLDGVIYAPTGKLLITGGGEADAISGSRIFVVNRLEMSGNGQIYLKGDKDILAEATGSRLTR
jgi:Flp pilus assembly protein TadG